MHAHKYTNTNRSWIYTREVSFERSMKKKKKKQQQKKHESEKEVVKRGKKANQGAILRVLKCNKEKVCKFKRSFIIKQVGAASFAGVFLLYIISPSH